jgi:hypothetical protein
MSFLNPVDIANRACQHCKVRRIDPTVGFAEDSEQSTEMSFAYDKLRRSELRRNVWRFSVRKATLRPVDTNTMLLVPTLWASTTDYPVGAIVSDADGFLWQGVQQDNLNNTPGNSSAWQGYFGPMTVSLYDTTGTTGYFAGELVYKTPGDGTYVVYLSQISGTSADPATGTAWDATVQYMKDQIVLVTATYYVSLIDFNLNQDPTTAPALWSSGTTYGAAATVGASDGLIYSSIAGGNVGNDPTLTTGFWTNTGVLNPWTTVNNFGTAGQGWQQLSVGLTDLNIFYPLGSGPNIQNTLRNIFRLPANYLRIAPQDPKAGSVSFMGAPTGNMYKDWTFEGNYFISREPFPITFRFAADIINVRDMDDMFCEGLGARIAMEVVGKLSQAGASVAECRAAYRDVMGEARTVNGIEQGAVEPDEDEYVTCRI